MLYAGRHRILFNPGAQLNKNATAHFLTQTNFAFLHTAFLQNFLSHLHTGVIFISYPSILIISVLLSIPLTPMVYYPVKLKKNVGKFHILLKRQKMFILQVLGKKVPNRITPKGTRVLGMSGGVKLRESRRLHGVIWSA